jgi:hypothetical protein
MANNPYVNKVVFGSATLVDLTGTTATADKILQGYGAYGADGAWMDGTASGGGGGGGSMKHYVLRPDAELFKQYTYDKLINADEGVTIPSYSTTNNILKSATTLETLTFDYSQYNYIIFMRALSIPIYNVTTKGKGRQEYSYVTCHYELTPIPANTIHALVDPSKFITTAKYSSMAMAIASNIVYYSSSNALSQYASYQHGACQAISPPVISNANVTIKSPVLNLRGNTTYFTQTYFDALTDIRYQYVIEIYRVPNNTDVRGWQSLDDQRHIIDCAGSQTQKLT